MPVSRSSNRNVKPLVVIGVLAVLAVAVIALPASLVKHIVPPSVRLEDFSGSLWHGSAGRVIENGRDAGAIEWRLHPASLLRLSLAADLHWVKSGFVIDCSALVGRRGLTASDIQGGGPIEDLRDFGVAAGWRGAANINFKELKVAFPAANLQSAVGDIQVSNLASPEFASGADLGGYLLHFADGAITPDADATAELTDTGGPLEVQAVIRFSGVDRSVILSGTVKERADAPAALRSQLDSLAQMHARDAQGRIPVDMEFTL